MPSTRLELDSHHAEVVQLETELREVLMVIHHPYDCLAIGLLFSIGRFQMSVKHCRLCSQCCVLLHDLRRLFHETVKFTHHQ